MKNFPRAEGADRRDGWTIAPHFLEQVQAADLRGDGYMPSLEGIETVLLALEGCGGIVTWP